MEHSDFVKRFIDKDIRVYIDSIKSGDLVLSRFANKYNKPAHLFWSWIAIMLVLIAPIVLWLLFSWFWAIISFILGLFVASANMKSSNQFVIENMLEDEIFYDYVMYQKKVKVRILDKDGNLVEQSGI